MASFHLSRPLCLVACQADQVAKSGGEETLVALIDDILRVAQEMGEADSACSFSAQPAGRL